MNASGESTESSVLGSQPVRNWMSSTWYRPTVSENPELQSLQPDSTASSTYNRDVAILSASFLFVFLAFNATQNLQSSINKEEGLGPVCLGVLYTSFTICSLGAPAVVRTLGAKLSIVLAFSGYWLYVAANLWPSWVLLLPGAVYLGFCASILWVAQEYRWLALMTATLYCQLGQQGTYLSRAAIGHARLTSTSKEVAIGSFNGRFWGVQATNQIIGNLVVLAVCLTIQGSTSNVSTLSPASRNTLFTIFLVSMTIGTTLAVFLRSQKGDPTCCPSNESKGGQQQPNMMSLARASIDLVGQPRMQLLVPLLLYSGFQQAFIWGSFTRDIVTPVLGVAGVGGMMAIYGAADSACSFVAGKLSTGLPSVVRLLKIGCCCHLAVMLYSLASFWSQIHLWNPVFLFLAVLLWGAGDATVNTQVSALMAIEYAQELEAAFSVWKGFGSIATATAFFMDPYLGMSARLLILIVLVAMTLFALPHAIHFPSEQSQIEVDKEIDI